MRLPHWESVLNKWLPPLFVLFWVLFAYDKADVLPKLDQRPVGEHLWAQIDRASMALTYYMDDAPFLLPRCHQTSFDDEGITAGEFPLIPYTVSKLYEAFGFNELCHRQFVLFLTLLGIPFAYKLMVILIGSRWWAAIVTALWFASPNIILYSFSFLPDGPAMAFVLMALYFLLKPNQRKLDLVAFGVLFALAGLLKLTSVALILPVLAAFLIQEFSVKSFIIRLKTIVIPTVLALAPIASWVLYARVVNENHHTFTFLLTPLPPESIGSFLNGLETLFVFKEQYYATGFWWFLSIATIIGLVIVRRADRFLGLSILGLYASFIAMFFLLFDKAPTHAYYWVPFQITFLLHLAWLFKIFLSFPFPKWLIAVVFAGVIVLINYQSIHIHRSVKSRWNHSEEVFAKYHDLEEALVEMGISYQDRVFSYQDESFNNSLYLMNRKGCVAHVKTDMGRTHYLLNRCNYAVLNDTTILSDPEFKHYFYQQIGQHKQLYVYRLHAQ
ncbi:MAG: glycosyltransferase family 39 protein [Flavobacteriales bacterium]|nr:glycosyltransferase family 39 protein [Flavobacteriales bacterium]